MGMVTRIALPGYNAKTDTNIDHFSLYSDIDNILIKRLVSAQPTITDGTDVNYSHNLGYIPFFVSFVSPNADGVWQVFNNQYNAFSDIDACAIDTTKIYFHNAGGHGSGNLQPTYDIFYDNMSDNTAPAIVDSHSVYKVARPSKSALSTNPNDYVMHSDLNNFKILKQAKTTINVTAGSHTYTVAHGFTGNAPYKFFCFLKFPDGTALLAGTASQLSYDELNKFIGVTMDATNINITGTWASSFTITVTYFIYGTGKTATIDNTGYPLKIAASGFNALTETNPDNFTFHSNYPTLKYFSSGSYDMGSISSGTEYSFAHGLGYTPFFIGFVKDLQGFFTNSYALMPYFISNSSIAFPKRNIGSWIYADDTNIYLKTWYDVNATATTHPVFYYKIFKNNLGL